MASPVLYIILAFPVVYSIENDYRNEGFMNHINTGIKLAQNLLGSESVALKVADFVVRAFHNGNTAGVVNPTSAEPIRWSHDDGFVTSKKPSLAEQRPEFNGHEPAPSPTAPWRYLTRLLGLRPSQISAVAVNALVFVAQMITSFLATPRRPGKPKRPYRTDEPIEWILNRNSKTLQDLIATAKNETLTDLVDELVQENGGQEETSCIRLLVCKITPFVNRMQRVVFGEEHENRFDENDVRGRGAAVLYRHLPAKQDIVDRSDVCEQRYKDCNLNE